MAKFFEYKGLPLVRHGNEIYFGRMGDPEVVYMQLSGKNTVGGTDCATKVRLYRMITDETVPPMDRIKKSAEKPNLFEALDLACDWIAPRGN